jgi:hypothetical protein
MVDAKGWLAKQRQGHGITVRTTMTLGITITIRTATVVLTVIVGLHCSTTVNLGHAYCLPCRINATDMHGQAHTAFFTHTKM